MSEDLQRQARAGMLEAMRLIAAGAPEGNPRWMRWEQDHGALTVRLALHPKDAVRGTEQAQRLVQDVMLAGTKLGMELLMAAEALGLPAVALLEAVDAHRPR